MWLKRPNLEEKIFHRFISKIMIKKQNRKKINPICCHESVGARERWPNVVHACAGNLPSPVLGSGTADRSFQGELTK
jgi:hypothetical protein